MGLVHVSGAGQEPGYVSILAEDDPRGVGLQFGLRRMAAGETLEATTTSEACWLLLSGSARVAAGRIESAVSRGSLFDEGPSVLHVATGESQRIHALEPTEWAVVRVANGRRFEPELWTPASVSTERRGAGLMAEAATRLVRLVFDRVSSPESSLVVGEVVSLPGRWSSYPPHHHDQPELYHYRFAREEGYGHAELGDEVFRVRSHDTLLITGGRDHAQVAAPGYAMYYLWVVRHLPENPYTGFTYADEHRWMLDADARIWEASS